MQNSRATVRELIYKEVSGNKPNLEAVYSLSREMTTEKLRQIMESKKAPATLKR